MPEIRDPVSRRNPSLRSARQISPSIELIAFPVEL
jgi:hypothetical protein